MLLLQAVLTFGLKFKSHVLPSRRIFSGPITDKINGADGLIDELSW